MPFNDIKADKMKTQECSILLDTTENPALTECGHYFDLTAITSWKNEKVDSCYCPACNHKLGAGSFAAYIQETVDQFFQKAVSDKREDRQLLFIGYGAQVDRNKRAAYVEVANRKDMPDIGGLIQQQSDPGVQNKRLIELLSEGNVEAAMALKDEITQLDESAQNYLQQCMAFYVAEKYWTKVEALAKHNVVIHDLNFVFVEAMKSSNQSLALMAIEQGADLNQRIDSTNLLHFAIKKNLNSVRDIILASVHQSKLTVENFKETLFSKEVWQARNIPMIKMLLDSELAKSVDIKTLQVPSSTGDSIDILNATNTTEWRALQDYLIKEKGILSGQQLDKTEQQPLLDTFYQRYREKVNAEWFQFLRCSPLTTQRPRSAAKLFEHAAGKDAKNWLFFKTGYGGGRSRRILHELGLMTKSGKATALTPDNLTRYCRR